jgi:peptide/nickel transport system permease protein
LGFGTYILRRLTVAAVLIFVVGTLNFAIVHLAPGGPQAMLLNNPRMSPQAKEAVLRSFGLDKPLHEQYFLYITGLVTGNWGTSYFFLQPAYDVIAGRIPATLLLMVPSLILTIVIGIVLGVLAARRPYTSLDRFLSAFSFFFYAMPAFWLGFVLLTVFVLFLRALPAAGMTSITQTGFDLLDYLRHLILPMTTLTLVNIANFSLLVRASLVEVLDQNYITTARGKGLPERLVFYRHALRNGLLPTVTMVGLFVGSIFRRDYPIVLGLFFMFSTMIIASNLVTDLIYGLLDPRITYD